MEPMLLEWTWAQPVDLKIAGEKWFRKVKAWTMFFIERKVLICYHTWYKSDSKLDPYWTILKYYLMQHLIWKYV